jgi:DNA-binding NarL/FixJ family response regulator
MEPLKRAILADDHGVVRSGIKSLLESEGDVEIIGEASTGREAIEQVKRHQPELAILDIRMPDLNGLEATYQISRQYPKTKVLILSMHDDEDYVLQSVENGASGYLLKGSSKEEFLKAVRTVHAGGQYFSADVSRVFVKNYLSARKPGAAAAAAAGAESHDYELTKRERQILRLITEGVSNKEIAEKLNKSVRTIETHRFNIMKKLDVSNLVELLKKIEEEKSLREAVQGG